MNSRQLRALVLGAMAALLMGAPVQAASVGHIPNKLTDELLVDPLKKSDSIWDVFEVLNTWISEVYPAEGDARTAIDAFQAFVKKYNNEEGKNIRVPRTIEMPLSVDRYLRLLRKETPGVSAKMSGPLAGNVKAQLYTAALLPFLHMRGITYRVRPLLAQSYVLHNAVVDQLRHVKQSLRVRTGTNGLAIFEYLTYPMSGRKREQIQFTKISELQDWVRDHFIPTLDVSLALAQNALSEMSPGQKESIDLSIFLQADNPFPDESMEAGHRYISTPEVEHFIARILYNRARLRLFLAYDLDEFPAVSNKIRDVYIKAFFKEKIPFAQLRHKPRVGSPPIVRYTITRKFQRFLTLKDGSQGPLALKDFRGAWKHYDRAMRGWYSAKGGGDNRVIDLTWLQATEKDYRNKAAPQVTAALNGRASITDYVGGATVDLDLPGFLTNLPSDLKDFFPSNFDQSKAYWTFDFSGGKVSYTNYDYGTPVGWDFEAAGDTWAKLFPTIRTEKDQNGNWDGPLWIFRDFSRSYVGRTVAPLLSTLVY